MSSASSSLDPDAAAAAPVRPPGHDTRTLGPSDRSDSGSDSLGSTGLDPATLAESGDAAGTGIDPSPIDDDPEGPSDIGFDRIVGAAEAGLGGGLDQAEEARLGITDEALDPRDEAGAALAPEADDSLSDEALDELDEFDDDADALDSVQLLDAPERLAAGGDAIATELRPDPDDPATGEPGARAEPGRPEPAPNERTPPTDEHLAQTPIAPTDAFASDPDARHDGGHRDVPVFDRATGGR